MALKKASKRFGRAFSDFRAQDIELRGAFQWYSPTTGFLGIPCFFAADGGH
jgi:hypothetical protein